MSIQAVSQSLAGIAGALGITLTASVAVAWATFRYLGDKWIANKFAERLEAFKHSQQREMERLRLVINSTFDRTVKLHGQEFEVLPELWRRLADAHSYVAGLLSPLQTYPDLDRMGDAAFEHFLTESELPEYQKEELRRSSQKTNDYKSMRFWQSYGTVSEKVRDFRTYYVSKGIFVPKEIKSKIEQLDDLIFTAMLEKEEEERHPDPRPGRWAEGRKFLNEGKKLREEIEAAIQARLWDTSALPADLIAEQEPIGLGSSA